MKIRPVGAEL